MSRLRFLTAGESHGPMLVGILDGVPAGIPLRLEDIAQQLHRRRQGYGRSPRQQLESDIVQVVGGVRYGRTTGAPVALLLPNAEAARWEETLAPFAVDSPVAPKTVPRPGHADLAALQKYDLDDVRDVLERASARETAMRVALSVVARRLLAEVGITIGSEVIQIGDVEAPLHASYGVVSTSAIASKNLDDDDIAARTTRTDASAVRCGDVDATARMVAAIDAARKSGQTLGGRFVVAADGLPPGLGSHTQWDRRLSQRLCAALASIHSAKAVAMGAGELLAATPGRDAHDTFVVDTANTAGTGASAGATRTSNRAGGLEGGITTGERLWLTVSLKPFSTVPGGLPSFDITSGAADRGLVERSDVCAIPAAGIVGEAMVALTLADALLEDLGGDSLTEIKAHVAWRRENAQRFRSGTTSAPTE